MTVPSDKLQRPAWRTPRLLTRAAVLIALAACQRSETTAPIVPAASPDARPIAFLPDSADREGAGLATMNADGTNVKWLVREASIPSDVAAWSHDGSQILFTSGRAGAPGLWLIGADGSGLRPLVQSSGDSVTYHGNWSPDGRLLAYTAYRWNVISRSMNYMVFVANADGSAARRLTTNAAGEVRQSWAPDGQHLVFAAYPDYQNMDIFTAGLDGAGQTQLTHGGLNDSPVWSPDGRRIAFERSVATGGAARYQIYVVDIDGSGLRQLTTEGENIKPAWSPNGDAIAFTSFRDGTRQLYRMRADGSEQRRLTGSPDARGGSGAGWRP